MRFCNEGIYDKNVYVLSVAPSKNEMLRWGPIKPKQCMQVLAIHNSAIKYYYFVAPIAEAHYMNTTGAITVYVWDWGGVENPSRPDFYLEGEKPTKVSLYRKRTFYEMDLWYTKDRKNQEVALHRSIALRPVGAEAEEVQRSVDQRRAEAERRNEEMRRALPANPPQQSTGLAAPNAVPRPPLKPVCNVQECNMKFNICAAGCAQDFPQFGATPTENQRNAACLATCRARAAECADTLCRQ